MPAITAADLIASSMRLIGATASGETPDANETRDALSVLNDLLEEWTLDALMVFVHADVTIPLQVGVATYTVGPTGGTVAQRPTSIDSAFARWQGVDYQVDVTSEAVRYNELTLKTQQGVTPELVLFEQTFPNATLTVWPVPQLAGATLTITAPVEFTQVPSSATTISYPPGYSKALRYALAVELAPEYGIALSPAILATATESKAAIKRNNGGAVLAAEDVAIVGNSGGVSLGAFIGGRV